jgi:hypothetical protein
VGGADSGHGGDGGDLGGAAAEARKTEPQERDLPVVEDGAAFHDIFGTVWIDDQYLLAWRNMGTQAIKTKGGKK